jgi:hypothetical protein
MAYTRRAWCRGARKCVRGGGGGGGGTGGDYIRIGLD